MLGLLIGSRVANPPEMSERRTYSRNSTQSPASRPTLPGGDNCLPECTQLGVTLFHLYREILRYDVKLKVSYQ